MVLPPEVSPPPPMPFGLWLPDERRAHLGIGRGGSLSPFTRLIIPRGRSVVEFPLAHWSEPMGYGDHPPSVRLKPSHGADNFEGRVHGGFEDAHGALTVPHVPLAKDPPTVQPVPVREENC